MATFKEKFINALFGTPVQPKEVTPSVSYGQDVDNYLNTLGTQPYMQGLLNQPKEVGLSLDKYKEGVANGLNYGIPEIAKRQDELGIRKPQTEEEIYQARLGDFNQPTILNIGTSNTPRQGGFLNDFASGFRENTTENFDIQNLAPDKNKGVATRLGEGLGSLVSLYNKPIGRGLLAGAAALALGGGAEALAYGMGAGVGRQTNMTRDKVYRNQLKQMGMSEDEVNAIPGIITDDIFKNYTLANYRNNMTNYRNLKLDKDTYIKQQQNIYKMLNDGVITAEEATRQMQLLNDEYQKQNPMDMQESNKTVQGNRRLDIMEKNADTYANNTDKIKIEDTDEYKQDLADYVMLAKDPRKRNKLAKFEAIFAQKYGKLPPKVQ